MMRRESTASDAESVITTASEQLKDDVYQSMASTSGSQHNAAATPLTPAASVASTPSASVFLPPPMEHPASRRSSFSSNAPNSPSQYSHYGRSPSPMPPLPAIRAPPQPQALTSARLYGDESFTNFFRRLTFSPDGGMLLTPAGQFEDPSVIPGSVSRSSGESSRGRRGNPTDADVSSASSVFIYTRANFARPPIAQLPGHKKASVAVKFSPILYDLRPGVLGAESAETKNIAVERGKDESVNIDLVGFVPPKTTDEPESSLGSTPRKSTESMLAPTPVTPHASQTLPSPALSAADSLRPPTPTASNPTTPALPTGSVFALPYRMLFAVATMDTITIHDTQQASPICMLTKLHYDEFTDMAWWVHNILSIH